MDARVCALNLAGSPPDLAGSPDLAGTEIGPQKQNSSPPHAGIFGYSEDAREKEGGVDGSTRKVARRARSKRPKPHI